MAWMRWALASNSCWSLVLASSRLRGVGLRAGVDLVQGGGQVRQHEGVRILRAEESCGPFSVRSASWLFSSMAKKSCSFSRVELAFFWSACSCSSAWFISRRFSGFSSSLQQPLGLGLADFDPVEQQADLALERLGVLADCEPSSGCSFLISSSASRRKRLQSRSWALKERFDLRFELGVLLVVGDHGRAADDQRRAGFVDQDRVDFVHDGVVMAALDLLLVRGGHAVVAQVIEAELGVGAVGDVAVVLLAADAGRLVVQDAADRQAQELVNRAHPLAVARGQVIVDRDHVHAAAGQGVQVDRQGGDQGLAFAGGHFRDPARVQRVAADQLHVERNHVPFQRDARAR